jgi:hypothetical protein
MKVMGQVKRRRAADPTYGSAKPHFTALETGFETGEMPMSEAGHEHGEFSVGDRLLTVLDGCILCGRLANVAMSRDHGASYDDASGGYTVQWARIEETAVGVGLFNDGSANHLCADCRAQHGTGERQLSDALHKRLDRLGDEVWRELQRRYDCPLCEIQWLGPCPPPEEAGTH